MTKSLDYEPPPVGEWKGQTYFGRQQVKPAPFEPAVVGGYIFLAGLSGASALIGAIATSIDARRKRRRTRGWRRERYTKLVRRSRYLSLLAPTIGSVLLIYDLHTPQRFYNMLRVAKKTSPMSIGTWILMSFTASAGLSAVAQFAADLRPHWRWPMRVARAAQVPAAIAGAGLSTYTASLLSATSTPTWAAAPRPTAVRFASSAVAAAAATLALGERTPGTRRALENLLFAALTVEAAGSVAADARYRDTGVEPGRDGRWGKIEKIGANGLGVMLPLGLLVASRLTRKHGDALATAAAVAAIAGSAVMRTAVLGTGIESARRPDVSMRFAQPDNLPARKGSHALS